MEYPVKLYIYDITKGMARSMSGPLLGKQLDGVWHTAIVVYDQEFFFGGMGIESCTPGYTILGQPDKVEHLGNTQIPFEMFMQYTEELSGSSFRPESYNLLEHNCNNFSDELAQFLTGRSIPSYITGLPQEVLNTPFGAMLRPMIEAMSVNPAGGTPIGQVSHRLDAAVTTKGEPEQPKQSPAATAVGATGASATVSKTPAVTSEPVIYEEKELITSEYNSVKRLLLGKLSPQDKSLVEEIVEYASAVAPDWGLSKNHVKLIEKILKDEAFSIDQKRAASGLLQEILRQDNIVAMLIHDPSSTYICVLQLCEQQDVSIQERIVKGLCNCSVHTHGLKWLLENGASSTRVASAICRNCLLHQQSSLQSVGARLAYNLTRNKVTEEAAIDFGCALVELLQKDFDDETVKHAVLALCHCIDSNNEVGAIAAVSGIDASELASRHPSLADLCNKRLKECLEKS